MNMTIKVDCKGCLEGKDTEAEEDNQDLYKLANFNIKETDIDAPENTKEWRNHASGIELKNVHEKKLEMIINYLLNNNSIYYMIY